MFRSLVVPYNWDLLCLPSKEDLGNFELGVGEGGPNCDTKKTQNSLEFSSLDKHRNISRLV